MNLGKLNLYGYILAHLKKNDNGPKTYYLELSYEPSICEMRGSYS